MTEEPDFCIEGINWYVEVVDGLVTRPCRTRAEARAKAFALAQALKNKKEFEHKVCPEENSLVFTSEWKILNMFPDDRKTYYCIIMAGDLIRGQVFCDAQEALNYAEQLSFRMP